MVLKQASRNTDFTEQDFEQALSQKQVIEVHIQPNREVPTGKVIVKTKDGRDKSFYSLDVKEVQEMVEEAGISRIYVGEVPRDNLFMSSILPLLITGGMIIFVITMMNRQMSGGGNNKMMNFGKSRARMSTDADKKVTFKDVAGLQEEKEELEEIVDFLKDPQKYTKVGARIPKGVLLVGPPGTGKTLLAKAVAGEAGVPFFSISGSDFVEMFVGVGASRVRDLFEEAKKNAPCIVFIDEIDAVARRRGTGMGGGHDEREQTLNQLLVEMDGFGVNEGIIVMSATNRVDILDPAILRPGRFDRKVGVGKPDVQGREEILKVHAAKKPLGEDVDLKELARTTAGYTGADLENLMNEAAIHTAKDGRYFINQSDVRQAFIKTGIGAEKKSRVISEEEKRITAYHEAGHAILFHVLPKMESVHTISIIPTGMGAAGYTMPLPKADEMFNSKEKMREHIVVSLGGRAAEEMIFKDVTTGASQDIKQATQMARAMVTQYGMSDKVGMIHYGSDDDEVFIGRDLAHTRNYAEQTAALIDAEVKHLIDEAYAEAKSLISQHEEVLHKCADLLLEKEKIGQEEFEALF
ncbi:ATP-dependent zinc metalloprotease FtsH [Blautia producta]|nr:ATP-dependent zinc metalloprotease FtsH [Blautia producta]NSG15078.1 ATP-dependent zinc metalloprotease FtsH [Blautia producta]NSJ75270.1 ATP-dependent zinc metalloprotease FtsH [Blautia producta]